MRPRQQRMLALGLAATGIAIAAALTLTAFEENMMFFVDVSNVKEGSYPANRNFRVGGLVVEGSVQRKVGALEIQFDLTDLKSELTVIYEGLLPDLFREGQGIIALGRINASGQFVADEVLAKHDEKYMPPEVAESLAKYPQENAPAIDSGTNNP